MARTCDACGHVTRRASARYCKSCGGPLGESDDEPPSAELEAAPSNRHAEVEWKLLRPVGLLYGLFLAISGVLVVSAKLHPGAQVRDELMAMGVEGLIVLFFAASERERLIPLLRLRAVTAKHLAWALGATVFIIAFITLYLRAVRSLKIDEVAYLKPYRDAGWPLYTAFLLIAVAAPVIEEIAFRGYIYARVSRVASERDAMFIQAGLFAVAHLLPMIFISHFVIGLALGALRRSTGSLVPGMLVHAAWNTVVLGLELYGR